MAWIALFLKCLLSCQGNLMRDDCVLDGNSIFRWKNKYQSHDWLWTRVQIQATIEREYLARYHSFLLQFQTRISDGSLLYGISQ